MNKLFSAFQKWLDKKYNQLFKRGLIIYFLALLIGIFCAKFGHAEFNSFIIILLTVFGLFEGLRPLIIGLFTSLGTFLGIKNSFETIETDVGKINAIYANNLTLVLATLNLPFCGIIIFSMITSDFVMPLATLIAGGTMVGLRIWNKEGVIYHRLLLTTGFVIMAIAITPVITSFAPGFGINISKPANWETNKANTALEQAEQKRLDEHREKTIAYIMDKLATGTVSETDANAYNDLMKETRSRKRLVLAPNKKEYVLTEIPSSVTKLIQKGENFFEG